jgi:type II secretion system protein H
VFIRIDKKGFSLVELVLIIGIIGILASIVSLSFNQMQRKAQVERHTREFFTELQTARSDSIFRKTRHSFAINSSATGYAFRRYSSENEDRLTGGKSSPLAGQPPQYGIVFTKTIPQQFAKEDGTSAGNIVFQFDTKGFALPPDNTGTIRINPVGSGASVDCVVVEESRTNLGQMVGGSCVQK